MVLMKTKSRQHFKGVSKESHKASNKRKFKSDSNNKAANQKLPKSLKVKQPKFDDELTSDSELSENEEIKSIENEESDSDNINETALEKKMRMTKEYLEQLKQLQEAPSDDEKDFVGEKLKEEFLDKAGKQQRKVADKCNISCIDSIKTLKACRKSVVSLAVSDDGTLLFTASKDCAIIKWCLKDFKQLKVVKGGKKMTNSHKAEILCLALSTDMKFLASGGMDNLILIWNPNSMTKIQVFRGHRNFVCGLVFRRRSHQLFSSSMDRTIKVWDLDAMGYIETLYGHQDAALACDSFYKDRCVTVGGRDGTVRLWKIQEESQLVFQGNIGSTECVRFINETHFISGSDDGSICLWSNMKKRPIAIVRDAHNAESPVTSKPRWITAVAALPNTDLVATGSSDGLIRLWKCAEKFLDLIPLFSIPANGFVNDLRFNESGSHLLAALGTEHKLGRWWTWKKAKNVVLIIPLIAKP